MKHDMGMVFYFEYYSERYADAYALLTLAQRYPLEQLAPIFSAVMDFRISAQDGIHGTVETLTPTFQLLHQMTAEQRKALTPEIKAILADALVAPHFQQIERAVDKQLNARRQPEEAQALWNRVLADNPDPTRFPPAEWERMLLGHVLRQKSNNSESSSIMNEIRDPALQISNTSRAVFDSLTDPQWVKAVHRATQRLEHWMTPQSVHDQLDGGLVLRFARTADLISVISAEGLSPIEEGLPHPLKALIEQRLEPNTRLRYTAWNAPEVNGWMYCDRVMEARLGIQNSTRSWVQSYDPARYEEIVSAYQAWLPPAQETTLQKVVLEPHPVRLRSIERSIHLQPPVVGQEELALPSLRSLGSASSVTMDSPNTLYPSQK